MNNISGILCAVLTAGLWLVPGGLLGWFFARSHARRGWGLGTSLRLCDSLPLLGIVVITALCLGCFFMLRADSGILWGLPEWVELYQPDIFRAVFLFEASFLCTAVTRVGYLNRGRSAWPIAVANLLLLAGVCGFLWIIDRPIAETLGDSSIDGVILQTSGSSCAAASLANVMHVLGHDMTEREAAGLLDTSRMGTVSVRLLKEARRLGFRAERFRLAESEWEQAPVPSVIFIDHPAVGSERHAVSLIEVRDNWFEVWDPLDGRLMFNHASLADVWHGRGIHIWKQEKL